MEPWLRRVALHPGPSCRQISAFIYPGALCAGYGVQPARAGALSDLILAARGRTLSTYHHHARNPSIYQRAPARLTAPPLAAARPEVLPQHRRNEHPWHGQKHLESSVRAPGCGQQQTQVRSHLSSSMRRGACSPRPLLFNSYG